MNIPCALTLKQCAPCAGDDPIRNITAEEPDVDVFIGFRDFRGNPPLGVTYFHLTCKSFCFSAVSQQESDDCALNLASECTWNTWEDPKDPPIPPGPDGGPGGGPNTTPGGVPTSTPRNRVAQFLNTQQGCVAECPDGTPFIETVRAGTVRALSQAAADAQAKSLACKRAHQDIICIVSDTIPGACVGTSFSFQFLATGGTTFSDGGYIWNVFGDLPPGLTLDGGTGVLSGTTSDVGTFTFQIEVLDASDRETTKLFTICVMEIVTEAALPNGTVGHVYSEPLVQEPGTVSSEQWTLVNGALPPGITLNANGSLTGTPTAAGTYIFTLQVAADC